MKINELIQHAENTIRLFQIYIVFSLAATLTGIWEYFLINRILTYDAEFLNAQTTLTVVQSIISILRGLNSIFIAFYFIRWFYFSYRFLYDQDDIYYLNYKPSATIWSWFVPVINLLYPFLVMRENYETWRSISQEESSKGSSVVLFWWLLFLITIIADYFGIGILEGINSSDLLKYDGNPWPFFIPGIIEVAAIIASLKLLSKFRKFYQPSVGE
jgi:hypothetical protein